MTSYRIDIEDAIGFSLQPGQASAAPRRIISVYRNRYSSAGRELKPQVLIRGLSIEGGEQDSDKVLDLLKPVVKRLLAEDKLPDDLTDLVRGIPSDS